MILQDDPSPLPDSNEPGGEQGITEDARESVRSAGAGAR